MMYYNTQKSKRGKIMKEELLLKNSKVPTLEVDKFRKEFLYDYQGSGSEGYVYGYDKKTAFKIFFPFTSLQKRILKLRKIELMCSLKDESFAFPQGFTGFQDGFKEGYFMPRIHKNEQYPTFAEARTDDDQTERISLIMKGDAAVQRTHRKGVIIGDIKENNILIDREWNPVFVDTDNYVYGDYGFDLKFERASWPVKLYKKPFSPMDRDKFLYALVSIKCLLRDVHIIEYESPEFFRELISALNVSKEVKNGLTAIFSDSKGKPYIGSILEEIDSNTRLLSMKSIKKLNMKPKANT